MNLIELLTKNFLVLCFLILLVEVIAGVLRIGVGKQYLFPKIEMQSDSHCVEMKTDVLLSHVHHHRQRCQIKGGWADGEYVRYNASDSTDPIIVTLGGSTTDGFFQHISAGDTYPLYLSQIFAEEYQILNGGVGAYSSLQELYKVIRDAPQIDNLYGVISLNGINEISDYHGFNEIRKLEYPFLTSVQEQMNREQRWIDQRRNFIMLELLPNLNSLITFILNKKTDSTVKLSNPVVIDAAERWFSNVTRIHDVLRGKGVRYYVFLQPTMGLKGPQSFPQSDTPDEKLFELLQKSYIKEIRNLYSELKRYCDSLNYCFDISDEVPPTGSMYADPRHHNSNGNKLLAQIIARIIVEQNTVPAR